MCKRWVELIPSPFFPPVGCMINILWLEDSSLRVGESFVGQYEIVHSLGECGSWGSSRGALQDGFGLIQMPFWHNSISQEWHTCATWKHLGAFTCPGRRWTKCPCHGECIQHSPGCKSTPNLWPCCLALSLSVCDLLLPLLGLLCGGWCAHLQTPF